jgi:hypothetical protein
MTKSSKSDSPAGDLTRRVADRLATANREVAKLVERTQDDPIAQYGAVLDANARFISALSEIVTMLAIEIERVQQQRTAPSGGSGSGLGGAPSA